MAMFQFELKTVSTW